MTSGNRKHKLGRINMKFWKQETQAQLRYHFSPCFHAPRVLVVTRTVRLWSASTYVIGCNFVSEIFELFFKDAYSPNYLIHLQTLIAQKHNVYLLDILNSAAHFLPVENEKDISL